MKIKTLVPTIVMASIVMGSIMASTQETNDDLVTVYSSRKAHLIKPLFDAFTKESGIKVEYLTGKGGALIERLKLEGKKPKQICL
jgi:iron(III) transport system substrate-binding protein